MSSESVYSIGLDVGGTKIAAGLVEFPFGRVVARLQEATRAALGGAQVLDTCVRLTDALLIRAEAQGVNVEGIGLGIAETVDRHGNITSGETIDWRSQNPEARLTEFRMSRRVPLIIDSDARAGALAEAMLGKGRHFPHSFLYITVGTGISYAPVLYGKPHAGARGNAIIFASTPQPPCFQCGQKSAVTLEQFAAGPALVRRYNEAGGAANSGADVLRAAAAGDVRAEKVIASAAEALAGGVASLVNALDPEAVVVGGGLGTAPGLYWEHFLLRVRRFIWAESTRSLPILQSSLGPDAGLVGASALPFAQAKNP